MTAIIDQKARLIADDPPAYRERQSAQQSAGRLDALRVVQVVLDGGGALDVLELGRRQIGASMHSVVLLQTADVLLIGGLHELVMRRDRTAVIRRAFLVTGK